MQGSGILSPVLDVRGGLIIKMSEDKKETNVGIGISFPNQGGKVKETKEVSSFEKDFPGLKGKRAHSIEAHENYEKGSRINIGWEELPNGFVLASDIQESCIDKQKVRDAIDKFDISKWDEMDPFEVWLKHELKKELGI